MNDATPAQNRTLAASEAESGLPTDQGAREALVEQLAEALRRSPNGAWMTLPGTTDIAPSFARAVLPLLAAQVEAAVSVVRAERDAVEPWPFSLRSAAALVARAAWVNEPQQYQDEWSPRLIDEPEIRSTTIGMARRRFESAIRALLAPSPVEGADFGSAYVPDLSADFAPGGDWHNALPSPAEGTGEASDGCGSDGGFGIGAGHRCTCNRRAGHGLDETDNWHGCECGALWECPECFNADMSGCAQCGAMPEAAAPAPVSSGEAPLCGHERREECDSDCVSSGEAGRTLGCMWCDEDSCNHGAMRAERESGETGQVATRWVDSQGDVWTFDADGIGTSRECANFSRKYVEKKWGPLRPAPVVTPSASTEGDAS